MALCPRIICLSFLFLIKTKNGKNKKLPGPVARDMCSESPKGTCDPLSLAQGTGHQFLEIEGGYD